MSKLSRESYIQLFDALLSKELYFSSAFASEENILCAIKRVLGHSIRNDCIIRYSDLTIDPALNLHFKIKDPEGDIIQITLIYDG